MEDLISVNEIADRYGKSYASMRKLVNKLNIQKYYQVTNTSRGQLASCIKEEDLKILTDYWDKTKHTNNNNTTLKNKSNNNEGLLYIILLDPAVDIKRFKIGFTTNINERLRQYRTVAPFAEVINSCRCKFYWERTATDYITWGCEKIGTEVFETNDINVVASRMDAFSDFMQDIN